MSLRLGVDIGGTFTDVFVYDEATGDIQTAKALSTPPTFVDGVFDSLEKIGINLEEVKKYIGHGSTIVDNILIERKLPKVALVTTNGYKDILETGRWWRGELYDLQWDKPAQSKPFVERRDIYVVNERIDSDGKTLKPLIEEEAIDVAKKICERGYESVAVFFINSYLNSEHEMKMAETLYNECPSLYVSISTELAPVIRELPRLSTSVINACILPVVDKYLRELVGRLRGEGFKGELLIIQSNGGVMRSDLALKRPIYAAFSGPAAGVVAAVHVAKHMGISEIISFDMGGTTAKTCIVAGGEHPVTTEYHFEWDIPISVPMIDMIELGAGGGSIAWIDKGGMLKVGPISAGSNPGPVCYLRGGAEPTVTDANLVLGYLDPEYFLGGEMKINKEAAKGSIEKKIADPLEVDVEEAARGIIDIINTNMVTACRSVTMKRGYDPRDFALMAFGGAGPMHSCFIAKELEIPRIIIPLNPGVFSAYGMCTTDFFHDYVSTYFISIDEAELDNFNELYSQLENNAFFDLKLEGISKEKIRIQRYAKMKYEGEPIGWGLNITVPNETLNKDSLKTIKERFNKNHEGIYGFSVPEEPISIVDLRVRGVGMVDKVVLKEWPEKNNDASGAVKGRRKAYFEEGLIEALVYDRYGLEPGNKLIGPAIIEEAQSTTLVLPEFKVTVDRLKNLILSLSR